MSLKNIVANNIKKLRIQSGLSQKEAAERLGLTGSFLGYLERGERNPGINIIEKTAQLFNVEPYTLLIDQNTDPDQYIKGKIDEILSLGPSHQQFIVTMLDAYLTLIENNYNSKKNL